VHNIYYVLSMWAILVQVIFFVSPALDWWSSPFSQEVFFLGFTLSILILMISIRLISIEWMFESFPLMIRLLLLIILPRFLHGFSSLALLIHVFILLDGLSQGLGIIIPIIFFIKGHQSTLKSLYFHLLTINEPDIL
jgi:hypothetical protein